jgi:signal transduction histidine kinase
MGDCEELRVSRARIAASAVSDRRRFERALHDGVQQDLIALSVGLQLMLELLDDPAAARAQVEELGREVHSALDRVRSLAQEIYPSTLDAQGLRGASRRYPPDVEAAIDLCSRTAAQTIREEPGRLVVELQDVADPTASRDLLEAAGATVTDEPDGLRAEFGV